MSSKTGLWTPFYTHPHLYGAPCLASPHPLLLWILADWSSRAITTPPSLCKAVPLASSLWLQLLQNSPAVVSTRWPSCLLYFGKKHFLPVEFQFRRIRGFLLLLVSELSCHPLLGFSALPSPIPTVTCIIFHRFRHSAWFLFSWLCFYNQGCYSPSETGAVLGIGWRPCTDAGRWRTHQQRFLQENTRDCFCSWHVDTLLVYLVSKLALPSNPFVARGSPVFQVDLCKLSKLAMLLSHGSLATVMTLCY